MAKSSTIGEMRTKVRFQSLTESIDDDGFATETWADVFSTPVWVKWVNAHGSEALEAARENLGEVATITMRFSPLVNVRCRVLKGADTVPYEIISLDNVDDRGVFAEIKVKRTVKA